MSAKTVKSWCILLLTILTVPLLNSATERTPPEPIAAERIISLSPNITEILFSLGLGERIVGVTNFCRYPVAAREKTKVGTLYDPNLELIISLKPDLIVLLPTSAQKVTTIKRSLNAKLLIVQNETIKDVLESLKTIGQATGKQDRANEIITRFNKKLASIKKKLAHKKPCRVLFLVGREPGGLKQIFAVGENTFLNEMLSQAGGENVIKGTAARYPIISKEQIIALNPEIILDASVEEKLSEKQKQQNIALWESLDPVSAVKNGQVYLITNPHITIPSSKIPDNIEYLYSLIHSRGQDKQPSPDQNKKKIKKD